MSMAPACGTVLIMVEYMGEVMWFKKGSGVGVKSGC